MESDWDTERFPSPYGGSEIMENKPVCYVPEKVYPEVFSGVPSFLGLPVAKTKAELPGYDFVIMGAPWEGICTYGGPSGTENATKTIRIASKRYGGYLPEFDFDIFDHFTGADYRDAAVKNGDREFTFSSVGNYMRDIMESGAIPITFGGDHSLSFPLIEAFAEKYEGNIGIVHFDSHMDNIDLYGEELYARCQPFHRLYDMKGFDPKNLVSIGIRGPRNNFNGLKEAKKYGASVITSWEVRRQGVLASIKKAIAIASEGTKAIYVTVCSDALDVAFNPGGPSDMCGLTSFELAEMLYECGLAGARGFDYMEVYPPDDVHNISSHCASWMTIYMMSGMAQGMLARKDENK